MELLRIDKSVEVFHTNASTSAAVTNGTSFSFLRTCSYLMLHYIKIPNLVLYDLD